jgi:2-polyprenyl-3-methyl-5-hydroxy-6-metoxy-1,4-benzoquinol methylase
MTSGLARHRFIVVDSPRLDFRDARAAVTGFIGRRLEHHGAGAFEFVADRAALDVAIGRISREGAADVDYVVVLDVLNPITDMDLVREMTATLGRTGAPSSGCEGAVPGTEVDAIVNLRGLTQGFSGMAALAEPGVHRAIVRSKSQTRHNNQLNVFKYKRLKMFLKLVAMDASLHQRSIDDVIATLATDRVFAMLAGFGEDVRLFEHDECPHCSGMLHALSNTMSQPFCGYLPSSRPLYHECEACGLVVQSPSVHEDDVHKVYDEWDKRDFVVSTNNPYTAAAPRCDFSKVRPLLPEMASTLDLGGGIGRFSQFLAEQNPKWNVTHSDFAIKASVEGVNTRALDFTREPIGASQYDLITAWEVIEHVPFHRLGFVLDNIARALRPGGFFAFSTPDFDSPLCKSFDFYALCPPFHYTVLGERWLRSYFAESADFEIFDVRHGSDFLDDALNWYSYGTRTCPSMAIRNTASVLRSVFELDPDRTIRDQLSRNGIGTEVIMTLRRKR